MADRTTREFPLFPLDLVALPNELVPLHIFEERYKTMMNECLRDEKEFGIVWLSDDGLRETGCACEIERVLERMEDGRMNLLARGTRPNRACWIFARRTPGCAWSAGCSRPRPSGWTWSSAPRSGRGQTARCAS